MISGSPVRVNNYMPDVQPGAIPVLYGDLQRTYMLVTRRALAMQPQPAGLCTNFLFDQRIGGATICPGASRLLRIN
jgi:HK97 family phage major capsid protein